MKPQQIAYTGPPDATTEAEIALRAFEKWHARNESGQSQLRDWLEAEDEIRQRQEMHRLLTKAERRLLAEHEVSRVLSASHTLGEAAPKIVQAVCERLGWDVGEFWLVERPPHVLRRFASWHRPNIPVTQGEQEVEPQRFSGGRRILERVRASRAPVWIFDMTLDAELSQTPMAVQAGLRGAVGIPLATDADFLGVINFFCRESRQPDEELIETMNSVLLQLNHFVERRRAEERLRREDLERMIAREVQQGLLPKSMPELAGFKIGARSLTAEQVGGDCFDFFPTRVEGREQLHVLIADASGHGLAAALLMAETRAYVRALALTCTDLGTLLALTNTRLAEDLVPGHFVTLFFLRLDPEKRSLQYVGAGHWPAYVLDRHGEVRAVLASTGVPVGIDRAQTYVTAPEIFLHPGDIVFLFTDGVVEAAASDRQMFGLKRALEIVRVQRRSSPAEILETLFQTVTDFSENCLQDDLTAVVIQVDDQSNRPPAPMPQQERPVPQHS